MIARSGRNPARAPAVAVERCAVAAIPGAYTLEAALTGGRVVNLDMDRAELEALRAQIDAALAAPAPPVEVEPERPPEVHRRAARPPRARDPARPGPVPALPSPQRAPTPVERAARAVSALSAMDRLRLLARLLAPWRAQRDLVIGASVQPIGGM